MKKLKLNKTGFAGAEVLSRAQLRKVMGGNGSGTTGSGSEDDCTAQSHWVEKPAYCGYGIGVRMPNGDCVVLEPTIKIPQPCGIA